jgi:glycerophosphoryl diester phosphodiesterase
MGVPFEFSYILSWIVLGVVLFVYQLFWYYPKKMRCLFGLENFSEYYLDHYHEMFSNSRTLAHRGTRLEGLPENSIAAFEFALTKGKADVIECDVWLTKDNEIIVHHDESLLRMTGKDIKIHDINYSDLPMILSSIPHQHERIEEYLSFFPSRSLEKHILRIPTLREVLELLPSSEEITIETTVNDDETKLRIKGKKYINIEFKQLSAELITKVSQLIYAMKKEKQVYWFSLDEKINKHLRVYDKKLPSVVSIQAILLILFYYYSGILPFIHLQDRVFGITLEEITLEKIQHEKATKKLPFWIQKILHRLFQGRPPKIFLSEKLFTHLRRRGIPIWFLGVNTEEDLHLAIDIGATAVFTDRIEWLTSAIENIENTTTKRFKKLYD